MITPPPPPPPLPRRMVTLQALAVLNAFHFVCRILARVVGV